MILGEVRQGRPFLTGNIRLTTLGLQGSISFLVDTGSSHTVVHPADGLFLGVPAEFFAIPGRTSTGIGGRARECLELCELEFYHTDGTIDAIEAELAFAEPTDYNLSYPSLLGIDVIGLYKLTYHLAENLVSLE
jgi:hypothetical protein